MGTPAASTEPGTDGDGGIPEDIPAPWWHWSPGGGLLGREVCPPSSSVMCMSPHSCPTPHGFPGRWMLVAPGTWRSEWHYGVTCPQTPGPPPSCGIWGPWGPAGWSPRVNVPFLGGHRAMAVGTRVGVPPPGPHCGQGDGGDERAGRGVGHGHAGKGQAEATGSALAPPSLGDGGMNPCGGRHDWRPPQPWGHVPGETSMGTYAWEHVHGYTSMRIILLLSRDLGIMVPVGRRQMSLSPGRVSGPVVGSPEGPC